MEQAVPATPAVFICLYTKQVRQKLKKWQDGFLIVRSSRLATLLTEGGKEVAQTKLPTSVILTPETEGLAAFEGVLVNCDGRCSPDQVPIPGRASAKAEQQGQVGDTCVAAVPLVSKPASTPQGFPRPFGAHRLASNKHAAHTSVAPSAAPLDVSGQCGPALLPLSASAVIARTDADVLGLFQAAPQSPWAEQHGALHPAPAMPLLPHGTSDTVVSKSKPARKQGSSFMTVQRPPAHVAAAPRTPSTRSHLAVSTVMHSSSAVCQPQGDAAYALHSHAPFAAVGWGPLVSDARQPTPYMLSNSSAAAAQPEGSVQQRWTPKWQSHAPQLVLKAHYAGQADLADTAVRHIRSQPQSCHPFRPVLASSSNASITAALRHQPAIGSHGASGTPLHLRFPSASEPAPSRHVSIPDHFDSAEHYKDSWMAALQEEITLKLAKDAKRFHGVVQQHGQGIKDVSGPSDTQSLEKAMRAAKVLYYSSCQLQIWCKKPQRPQHRGGKRKHADAGEDDDIAPESPPKQSSAFLVLSLGREKSTAYRQDDLWVLSSSPTLCSQRVTGPSDSSRQPWTVVARSCWHGPNPEGRMEIEFLTPKPAQLGRSQPVFALHGPEAGLELGMLRALQGLDAVTLPLLRCLLQPHAPAAGTGGSSEAEDACLLEASQTFCLNPEQLTVLQRASAWFASSQEETDLCVVHGPFGTGKSSLLVALICYLVAKKAASSGPLKDARILVAAHTNVAVDRVLTGLADAGVTDFLRIGSLRRIEKSLLKYSLHCSDSRNKPEAVSELHDMLKEATSPTEAAIIRQEIAEAQKGAERQRRRQLKNVSIVGVTCCSASLSVLDGHQFDIVILDECSQVVEPLSLLPLVRAKCRYLVVAGDPCQLPPVVASPAAVTTMAGMSSCSRLQGLGRPLFLRLMALRHEPHLLRRQYRCHPELSEVPNNVFYGGRLLNGCSAEERPPVAPGLPPLCVLDVRGLEQQAYGGGASNQQEAFVVAQALRQLLGRGVMPDQCGVICFYRAQVGLIKGQLGTCGHASTHNPDSGEEHDLGAIQVATVDSFQGAEKDIIFLSTAVTRVASFAADAQRLNVALTRARRNLVIVGCVPALQASSPAFAQLLAKARQLPRAYCQYASLPLAAADTRKQDNGPGVAGPIEARIPSEAATAPPPLNPESADAETHIELII